jgi:hypothetical protein
MNVGVFNINASFAVILLIYFTLDLGFEGLGFLRVGEKGVESFIVEGFERIEDFVVVEGVGDFVFLFFSSVSSSSFCLTSCVMTYFICLVSA